MNMSESTWKMADILIACLIALVIGVLFSWWASAVVFGLGLILIFRSRHYEASLQHSIAEDEKAAKDLLEWNEWEVTYGPSAPGIANPGRRDG